MSEIEKLEKGFLDTLSALDESLDKIIIVGGWCPYLYTNYLWQRRIPNIPTTTDIDLGVMETGAKRFDLTVYDKLKKAGFQVERLYEREEEPIEFVYKKKELELKVEFITSFETSDDTLNRFLGSKLACNRIEAFEVLLEDPIQISIKHLGKNMSVSIPKPETFLFHKGISFVMRSDDFKRDKDLFYVYFVLKFAPDQKTLLESIARFKKHEYFKSFKQNLRHYLSEVSKPGYLMLWPFLKGLIDDKKINDEIRETFALLFQIIK